jgi:hypothetical protein
VTQVRDIFFAVLADRSDDSATLSQRLCVAAAESLDGLTGVGMALMSEGRHVGMLGATDGAARMMEELQFTLGEGPCLDAAKSGLPVLQPDLAETAPERWPGFGPAVLGAGIAAIFAFPLQVGGIRLGVLDLYRDRPGVLSAEEFATALAYADAAVLLLLYLQEQRVPGAELHPQLADAVGSRPEVHQATGMISVQADVALTEALLMLRAHAFATERPLLEVARDVVQRTLRFDVVTRDNGT